MKLATAGRYARALIRVAAARGRVEEAVAALSRAAGFFRSAEGGPAEAMLQSSRVPAAEREALLDLLAEALGMPAELRALVATLSKVRGLRALRLIARRARACADAEAEPARAELRTAVPLDDETLARIRAAVERVLGRGLRLDAREDPRLLAGVVLRVGNRIWDGSLAGRLARARGALGGAVSAARRRRM